MIEPATPKNECDRQKDQALILDVLARPNSVPREALLDAMICLTEIENLETPIQTLLYQIIGDVVAELETSLRARISENIADRDDVPHPLALTLAQDIDPVALPVLQYSPVLLDADLLPIIESRPGAVRMAVAARVGVSEVLCDALVQIGEYDVLCAMAANASAHISETALYQLADIARDYDPLQSPMVHRHDLPQTLQIQMISWVSSALRGHLLSQLSVNQATLDHLLIEAVVSEVSAFVPSFTDGKALDGSPVDESCLLAAVSEGNVSTCFGMLECLSGASMALVLRAAFDLDTVGVVVLARSFDMSRSGFATVFGALRSLSIQQPETLRSDVIAALQFYDHLPPQNARDAIERWMTCDDFEQVLARLH